MSDSNLKKSWITEFHLKHGRAPRILHVGNIAGNAYKNAKVLNSADLQCDVLCFDYYHMMATPEWEDAEFTFTEVNHSKPVWRELELHGFERPRWFIQGSLRSCVKYIRAKHHKNSAKERQAWLSLCADSELKFPSDSTLIQKIYYWLRYRAPRILFGRRLENLAMKIDSLAQRRLSPSDLNARLNSLTARHKGLKIAHPLFKWGLSVYRNHFAQGPNRSGQLISFSELQERFAEEFPTRTDKLEKNDLEFRYDLIPLFHELFSYYDLVQCYSTDPVFALLTNKRPYVCFEHGTLRHYTQEDSTLHRLTALAYNRADHVFITNGDCLEYGQKIGVKNWSGAIHPIDVAKIRSLEPDPKWRNLFPNDKIFLCPLRHDWEIKGTDMYIRALPLILERIGRQIKIVMTAWGEDLARSKKLAFDLGVDQYIFWIEPLSKVNLIRAIKSVDAVFDQMVLHCFGATAPEAIASETPVIMSYRPETTAWIMPQSAPILSAFSPTEIADCIELALNSEWLVNYKTRSRLWTDEWHSDDRVLYSHLEVYGQLLGALNATVNRERSIEHSTP